MSFVDTFDALKRQSKVDASVGIGIAKLLDGEGVNYYATSLPPGAKISPHYHQSGHETYLILQGRGLIHTRSLDDKQMQSRRVQRGSIFDIPPNTVHQLENDSNDVLILVFTCKPSHLGEDRVLA
ncbi:cupin domain-containing protein [Dyella mobilis]|uniref:Cupin domain-containing protein n=1 Tax=Dyella mobilis TaxID=1849582 RepID=A0ABS2KGK7_9GAMM|nr:cupin domain-containing protein [Dyella mobilis]MBM7130299.1 cupin domain-containing protein [Dyella mobilis]GLQ96925.1 hypothetical protein GCM10007863_13450 [Dyella mobilis]